MFNFAVLKQDFLISRKTLAVSGIAQLFSLFLATLIRNMRLIDISDIFWDTLPVVIIPMAMQIALAYELVNKFLHHAGGGDHDQGHFHGAEHIFAAVPLHALRADNACL